MDFQACRKGRSVTFKQILSIFSLSILYWNKKKQWHCWVVLHCPDRCHLLQKKDRGWGRTGGLRIGMVLLPQYSGCRHATGIAGNAASPMLRSEVTPLAGKGEGVSLCWTRRRQEFQEGKGSLWSTWHEELPSDHGNSSVGSQPENRATTAMPQKQKKSERSEERGGGGVGGVGERSWSRISLAETERLPGRQIQPIMLVGFTGFPFHFQSFLLPLSFPFQPYSGAHEISKTQAFALPACSIASNRAALWSKAMLNHSCHTHPFPNQDPVFMGALTGDTFS